MNILSTFMAHCFKNWNSSFRSFFPDTMSYSKRLMLIIKVLIVASVEGSSSHLFFAHFAFIEWGSWREWMSNSFNLDTGWKEPCININIFFSQGGKKEAWVINHPVVLKSFMTWNDLWAIGWCHMSTPPSHDLIVHVILYNSVHSKREKL